MDAAQDVARAGLASTGSACSVTANRVGRAHVQVGGCGVEIWDWGLQTLQDAGWAMKPISEDLLGHSGKGAMGILLKKVAEEERGKEGGNHDAN